MRSSSSGIVASEIGERSGRKQNAPNSHSIVVSLTRGVTSSRSELAGWVIRCHAAWPALLPRAV